jgi:hypothetical protein
MSLCHFYKLSHSWLLGMCCCSCLLWPGLFIYSSVRDSSPLPFSTQGTPPSLLRVSFFVAVIAYYSFFFFPWVGVGLSRGLCWSGPGLSVGVPHTLRSPCGPHLPKSSGHWHLSAAQEPSWFLPLTWSGDTLRRLEVWRSQSFASSPGEYIILINYLIVLITQFTFNTLIYNPHVHMKENKWYLSFWIWLTSRNMMITSFNHFPANDIISFFFYG